MKNMNDIRRNLRAVEQTRQITNAMYLLSASLSKKLISQISHNQLYMRRIRSVVREILEKSAGIHHAYLDRRENGRAAFLIISSDKGLCGAYNYNICDCAEAEIRKYADPHIESLGICGTEILINHGIVSVEEEYDISQKPSVYTSRLLGEHLINLYNDIANEVFIVYTLIRARHRRKLSACACCRLTLMILTMSQTNTNTIRTLFTNRQKMKCSTHWFLSI